MAKILSEQEIESMQSSVKSLASSVEDSKKACETVINSFTNEAIVESFYASGKYGKKEKEEIEKILNAVNKYYGVIAADGGLIAQTNSYLSTQLSLLQSGKVGQTQVQTDPYNPDNSTPPYNPQSPTPLTPPSGANGYYSGH